MTEIRPGSDLIFDENMVEFYKVVARRMSVHEDDIAFIFDLPSREPVVLASGNTQIKFNFEDTYKAAFECATNGNALALSGDNQRNKTTSLLCIAALLGYMLDSGDNARFLGDDEFVKKGKELRRELAQGRGAFLELVRGDILLKVEVKDRKAIATHRVDGKANTTEFSLSNGWSAFERYMGNLLDVQLVSKGRKFIERVEGDILDEMKILANELLENSSRAESRLASLSTGRAVQKQTNKQVDKRAVSRQIIEVDEKISTNKKEMEPLKRLRDSIFIIRSHLRELGADDRQMIERMYRLERDVAAAEEEERRVNEYEEYLEKEEGDIEQLRADYEDVKGQKAIIDGAFERLQADIVNLFDTRHITSSPEIEALRARIEASDIKGVCGFYYKGIKHETLSVYYALTEAIRDYASPDVALLPFADTISDAAALFSRLKSDIERVKNFVATNEVIEKFMAVLEATNIELTRTPYDYEGLDRQVAEHENALNSAEDSLRVRRENQPKVIMERASGAIKSQLEQAKKQLSDRARKIKEDIEDTISLLEEPDSYRKLVWSVDALSDLQKEETEITEQLLRLRKKQHDLEQQKQKYQDELEKSDSTQTSEIESRLEHVRKFINDGIYSVIAVVSARTDDDRKLNHYMQGKKVLSELGLEHVLEECIDGIITKHCRYYYDNSGETCKRLPLDTIIYRRRGRDTTKFIVNGNEFDRSKLSGGTESVMTVRSLVSRPSAKPLGVVLLVDEWGDVRRVGEALYDELRTLNNLFAAVFVNLEKDAELTATALN